MVLAVDSRESSIVRAKFKSMEQDYKIRYNQHNTLLGYFNDPVSGEIVFKLVWRELYG